jgi:hypothetical protein
MPDIIYKPSFEHTNWVDNEDVVLAGGLEDNGFNRRFNALAEDSKQLADIIAQINADLRNGLDIQVSRRSAGNDAALLNGDTLLPSDLALGLRVLLNRNIDPASVTRAACFVTLELPFAVDQTLPGPDLFSQTVGFQPVVLDATVVAKDASTIAWNPGAGTQRYLTKQLPNNTLIGGGELFAADWDVFPSGTSGADWQYTPTGAEAIVSSTDQRAFAGFMAINKQPPKDGETQLRMLVSPPPPFTNETRFVGLVFNFVDINNFWQLTFSAEQLATSTSGGPKVAFLSITHYVNGAVASPAASGPETKTIEFDLVSNEGTGTSFIGTIEFVITSLGQRLSITAQSLVPGRTSHAVEITMTSAPQQFLRGSRVGLVTNWGGKATFSGLQVIVSPGPGQTLLDRRPGRLLSRLTVKRDLLLLAGAADPVAQATPFPAPRPDFSMWFFVQTPVPESVSSTIGGDLL